MGKTTRREDQPHVGWEVSSLMLAKLVRNSRWQYVWTGCMNPDCNTASWELRMLKQGRLGPRTSNGEQDETHSAKQTAIKNCYPEVRRRPRPAKREKVWTKQQSVCTGFCKSGMSKTLGSDYCLAKRRWAMIVEKKKIVCGSEAMRTF